MASQVLNLEESTSDHPQLAGKGVPEVAAHFVASALASKGSRFLGKGSFCRVWSLGSWKQRRSAACGQPVAIKVYSAEFSGLVGRERQRKHDTLSRHWSREVNAHLLLEGQPRVVRIYHTFQGTMSVPSVLGDGTPHAQTMQVVGLVEELCSETSLYNFLRKSLPSPQLRSRWPLHHAAAEFAALLRQVDAMLRVGVVHQDINLSNIMVHLGSEPGSLPVLKLGDWNGAQWIELTLDGNAWVGTVGFMPHRIRQLHTGKQQAAKGVGELNYDVYQMGKTLLRVLLEQNGTSVAYVRSAKEMEGEEAAVKAAAVHMLTTPEPEGEVERELWIFGVLIGLQLTWDGLYTSAADQLRMTAADAGEVLDAWAALCRARQSAATSRAFWGNQGQVEAMARLYLDLMRLARLPPLGQLADAAVHTQEDEYSVEVAENFFLLGSDPTSQRLAPVKAKVAAILEEQRQAAARAEAEAAAEAAAATEAAATEAAAAERRQRRPLGRRPLGSLPAANPSFRQTAWEQKLAARAEAEEAFLSASSSSPSPSRYKQLRAGAENAAPAANAALLHWTAGTGRKRKAGDARPAAAAENAKPMPPLAALATGGAAAGRGLAGPAHQAAKPAAAAAAVAGGEANGGISQDDALVLNTSLRHKHLWSNAHPPANLPQFIGEKHAVAVMLGDTLRAAAAAGGGGCGGGGGEVCLHLGAACCLRFVVDRRSLVFSRQQVAALAGDQAACQRWNSFVAEGAGGVAGRRQGGVAGGKAGAAGAIHA